MKQKTNKVGFVRETIITLCVCSFIACIPIGCFVIHPAIGWFATGFMGIFVAKCLIDTHIDDEK